jgi:hypothetical protein
VSSGGGGDGKNSIGGSRGMRDNSLK